MQGHTSEVSPRWPRDGSAIHPNTQLTTKENEDQVSPNWIQGIVLLRAIDFSRST